MLELDECIICMSERSYACVVGCDHRYCTACIEEWCTQGEALCPICKQPIYGIVNPAENVVYLSPHDTSEWGLTASRQTVVPDNRVVLLTDVVENSVAFMNGLRRGDYVRIVCYPHRERTFYEIMIYARDTFLKTRILKLERVDSMSPPPAPPQSRGHCGKLLNMMYSGLQYHFRKSR